jgi:DUF1680 family protein
MTASINKEQRYSGVADSAVRFLLREQINDSTMWKRFVNQFRDQIDGTNRGWRGEYWGKTIRGAILIYEYTKDEDLYDLLTETVKDMLTVAEEDGRVSSFSRDTEFTAWDIWCRKYVLLGMEYYYDVCRDEDLKAEIISYMKGAADYILAKIGKERDGKKPITLCCYSWLGLNASSILEPMVWLYRLTGEKRYLDFATYIVEIGGSHMHNIFELAYENKLAPYQYGVEKAYEMISCFEGLLEYYRATGIEKYKTAAINFGKAILDTDVTVIGSCGCTHELFDHSKVRQTAYYEGIMQETCVTVTWMKFCGRLLKLTGDSVFADAMEQAFYNAYLGSFNTERRISDDVIDKYGVGTSRSEIVNMSVPFDSYSPLIPGKRGRKNAGLQILADKTYYSCCAAIGAAGVGVFLRHAVLADDNTVTLCFYESGSINLSGGGKELSIQTETAYPADGAVRLTISSEKKTTFDLKLRIPAWSSQTEISASRQYTVENGYAVFSGEWCGKTSIEIKFDMSIRETLPIPWETDVLYTKTHYDSEPPLVVFHKEEDDHYISLARGPLTLAADSRTGKDAHSVFEFCRDENGKLLYSSEGACEFLPQSPCILRCSFPAPDGTSFTLVDYSSAGKDWSSHIAAWLPTK